MEQLRGVAVAHYNGSSAEDQKLARELFSDLDVDGDGCVSKAELEKVIGSDDSADKFFAEVDHNGDGTLDFEEVLTLYYMAKAQIRSCDACSKTLYGSYFSCVLCEKDHPNCYDLCCACYGGGTFRHHHSTDNFLDDRSMRKLLVHFLKQQNNITVSSAPPPPPPAAVVQHNYSSRDLKLEKKIKILENSKKVIEAVNALGNFAIQAGACIIM